MGQQLGIKCCQEMFRNDSIESEDEYEGLGASAELLPVDTNTSTQNVNLNNNNPPIKQNKNNRENADDDGVGVGHVCPPMNKKTMELLLKVDDVFAPQKSNQNEEDYRIQETNIRLKELQQLSNPEDLETAIFANYATDSDTGMDTAHLDIYGLSASSLDEVERQEIARLKASTSDNDLVSRSKSNVYRQATTTPWTPEDIYSLHDEMKQEYMNLSRQNTEKELTQQNISPDEPSGPIVHLGNTFN
eukprot:UN02408